MLALAGGAVAAGFLIQEVDVQCLTPDAGGGCPEGQVVSRTTNRPYLMASLAAAAAVGIAGAIEAYVEARGRRGATPFGVASADPGLVVLPGVGARGGRVDVGLLGLRFR